MVFFVVLEGIFTQIMSNVYPLYMCVRELSSTSKGVD